MQLRILTYNVKYNKALPDVLNIIKDHSPDIICLQEVSLKKRHLYLPYFPGYRLAATSYSFFKLSSYGLATFYKTDKFYLQGTTSIALPKTWYELVVTMLNWRGPRTALRCDLLAKETMREISVYNLHLTALVATNKARNRQIKETLEDLDLSSDEVSILAGDFNYPFRRKGLERVATKYGLSELTQDLLYTHKFKIGRLVKKLKFDFVLGRNVRGLTSSVLEEYTKSDHFPVFVTVEV